MYKIYLNNIELILVSAHFYNRNFKNQRPSYKGFLECSFQSKDDFLFLVETLEKAKDLTKVMVIGENAELMLENFMYHFKKVEAAGGLVKNKKGQILMMLRKGIWDLPKGKLEREETHLHGAIREVEEETGLKNIKVRSAIRFNGFRQKTTLHTYRENGKRILKFTYWFLMEVMEKQVLVPQTEEGITQLEWVSPEKLKKYTEKTYGSIRDVLATDH